MKQFQKYGVAAAVASMAAGAVATEVSRSELGDLAIVPYYTVNNGFNTGVHIINTSDSTQVVKFRLRRGADSKDALDFNIVMSPRDEWTGNITKNDDDTVVVETNDTTCTVPEFPAGGAPMPSTFAAGATEGYIEIIAMAQTSDEDQPIAVNAEHAKGVPADCDAVRNNFFRVTAATAATAGGAEGVKGVHASDTTSDGAVSGTNSAQAISSYVDSANPLKVSFMITDSEGGLEFGDNAVMVENFSSDPMMTNQQALSFGDDGLLNYDALNFELPNLSQGALDTVRSAGSTAITDGSLYNDLRAALDADKIMNDWAAIETDTATVATDWVVTLPGQYAMTDPVCGIYAAYDQATAGGCTSTALARVDKNELPLTLAENPAGDPGLAQGSNMILWDREEKQLNGTPAAGETPAAELGFSPGGSAVDPAAPNVTASLKREVNVISFNGASVLGTADTQEEDLGLGVTVTVEGGDRGWAQLDIVPTAGASIFTMTGTDAADATGNVKPDNSTAGGTNGSFTAVANASHTAVIGMAVWERQFSGQAGNYGRAIEHTTMVSSGNSAR